MIKVATVVTKQKGVFFFIDSKTYKGCRLNNLKVISDQTALRETNYQQ